MANRFRNIISTRSNYLPQQFIPDFTKYAGMLTNQQKLYDQAQSLRDLVPKHLQVDAQDVEAYRSGVDSSINNLAQIYNTQGVAAGNRQRTQLLRDVRRDWQPGGKAYNFQQNYSAYQDYVKQLDEMHKSGKISSDKRNALASKSMQIFGKSYGDQDEFKQFSGITAAEDVDLAKQADELAKGWAESQLIKGVYTIKGGQYYDVRTQKYVDAQEIYDNILPQLLSNSKNAAYFNQSALLGSSGLSGQEIGEALGSQAAKFAAEKYGKVEEDSKWYKNWALQESIKLKNKKKLIDYENSLNAGTEETVAYTIDTGLPPLDISENKIRMPDINFDMTPITAGGGVAIGKSKQETYAPVPLEEFASSPQGIKQYPGLSEMINMPQFQRQRGKEDDPNWVEPDESYNKRIAAGWESKRKALSVATGKFSEYNDAQQTNAKKQIFGDKGNPGSIVHKTIWLKSPGKGVKAMTYRELLSLTGKKTIEELNDGSNVLGTIEADNGINPSGYEAVVTDKNGKNTYQVIIGQTSIQDKNYNEPIFNLTSLSYDGTRTESDIQIWQPAGNLPAIPLRSRARDLWNGQNFAGRTIDLYEIQVQDGYKYAGTDPSGNILVTDGKEIFDGNELGENGEPLAVEAPSEISPEQLIEANRNLNPYLPTRMNKRLENK